jgi:threonine/homoserine/homoserine lactone efflux protein
MEHFNSLAAGWQIDLSLLAAFAWFAWVGSVTPGPNCALALATAANFGARSVGPHMLGVAIGFSAMLLAALLGAHGLLAALPWLAGVLKWLGIAWLAWLGVQLARSRGFADGNSARPPRVHESTLLQFANPKGWMLMTATVGAYQDLARPTWLNAALIVAIFVACCTAALAIWAWLGASLRRWLADGRRLAWFNGLLGLSLLLTAGWLALA